MAVGDVEIVLLDIFGERVQVIGDFYTATYARSIGFPGSMTLELPLDAYDPNIFQIDGRVEFWRDVEGGRKILDTETPFFIRRRRRIRDESGDVRFVVSGPAAVELCTRRIVDYPAASQEAISNAPIDSIMVQVMKENFGTLATASRRVSSEFLDIPSTNPTLGPTSKVRYARRNVLELFRDLMYGSYSSGTPVFFDVVRYDQRKLAFRTYVGQRGANHGFSSPEPVVFSADAGNLAGDEFDENYDDEITAATAGGSGEEADRVTATYNESTRSGRSPFGRREAWVDARDSGDADALEQDATQAVNEGRPKNAVAGTLQSTSKTRYGVHWGFGDRVVAEIFGFELEVWVNAVSVSIDTKGGQNITAKVESVEVTA